MDGPMASDVHKDRIQHRPTAHHEITSYGPKMQHPLTVDRPTLLKSQAYLLAAPLLRPGEDLLLPQAKCTRHSEPEQEKLSPLCSASGGP